jgi:hypothetical protein
MSSRHILADSLDYEAFGHKTRSVGFAGLMRGAAARDG